MDYRRSPAVPEHEWTEEYDYVRLESRTAVGRRNAEIRAALPDKLQASFDTLVRDADHAGEVRKSGHIGYKFPDFFSEFTRIL